MSFHQNIVDTLDKFLESEKKKYPLDECLKIDLHCHDHNSNKPDEQIARILNVPETWLPTETLLDILQRNNCSLPTITNHNNARGCYELLDKGHDVLVGAEFTVTVPSPESRIHVLAYGFTPAQEAKLNKLRSNLFNFQAYAVENNIPTIWAHPLFHYRKTSVPSLELYEKLSLIFKNFETMNGQRDTWQNMLVKEWVESLTPEKIEANAKKHGIKTTEFLVDPYTKVLCGGSDEHMGIFTGQTGVYLHVPDLANKLAHNKKSELALEALREGRTAVFGSHHNSEKMTIAFIDYFFQLGLNIKDPGLMRILLHKGETQEKALALLVTNGFLELRRHKITTNFIKTFHRCFLGEDPGVVKKLLVPKRYKPVFKEATQIAKTIEAPMEERPVIYKQAVENIFDHLTTLLLDRIKEKSGSIEMESDVEWNKAIMEIDVPAHFRSLFSSNKLSKKDKKEKKGKIAPSDKPKKKKRFKLNKYLDGLPFPALASAVITLATFISAKVLYNTRPLLECFAKELGVFEHPKRMLWLTDTFDDKNGVSVALQLVHQEIKRRNLPIDILVCSDTVEPDDHLIVVKPKGEFRLPFYKQQPIRMPNILKLHQLFKDREYDRIIVSTEGPMGIAGLFLKQAYSVPAYFYIHTDWLMFGTKVLNLSGQAISRVRRFLRMVYKQFDHLFVLNTDQEKWLKSSQMGIKADKVHLTAHWVDSYFKPQKTSKKELFGISEDTPVLLFAGRISKEKGATDVPDIYKKIRSAVKNIQVVFAGIGPAEKELKKEMPDAIFLGWVEHAELPKIYSAADLVLLPSVFDTFGCVILEALSCGTPVISYKTKGPKDIILHEKCGYLGSNKKELGNYALNYFKQPERWQEFSNAALSRAADYNAETIIDDLMKNIELT